MIVKILISSNHNNCKQIMNSAFYGLQLHLICGTMMTVERGNTKPQQNKNTKGKQNNEKDNHQ